MAIKDLSVLDDFFAWLTDTFKAENDFEQAVLTGVYDFLDKRIKEYKNEQEQ